MSVTTADDRPATELWAALDAETSLVQAYEVAAAGYPDVLAALEEIEVHCPCGARPESLDTHPHVVLCPVGDALAAQRARILEALNG